jgi:hypothetical protein
MTLEEMTLLARCNGLHTQTFRPSISPTDSKFEIVLSSILEHSHSDHTHMEEH